VGYELRRWKRNGQVDFSGSEIWTGWLKKVDGRIDFDWPDSGLHRCRHVETFAHARKACLV
jgi:hypothetical protein